jgi:hypothetical protein
VDSVAIASIVFVCVFGVALLGMALGSVLPKHHLSADSKDVVKLAMGLIATMAALVLGLLTSSAKSAFDTQDNELKQMSANVILLDRVLAQYGPESKEIRDQIRAVVAYKLAATWPEDGSRPAPVETPGSTPALERLERRIRDLSAQDAAQRALQARALQITGEIAQARWLLFGQEAGNSVQMPLLVVLVFWVSALFGSFGLFAPRNGTVIGVLCIAALSVSGSIFLILEMNRPFEGLVKISGAPLRYALSQLGQ